MFLMTPPSNWNMVLPRIFKLAGSPGILRYVAYFVFWDHLWLTATQKRRNLIKPCVNMWPLQDGKQMDVYRFSYEFFLIITQKSSKRKRKHLPKKWRDLRTKGTHKHTEASFKLFDDHRYLSRSEESKCMWTQGNDRLVGLVVSMSDYWSWGRGFDPRHFQPREDNWVATLLRNSVSD